MKSLSLAMCVLAANFAAEAQADAAVQSLLKEWKLAGAFAASFTKNNVNINTMRRGQIDEGAFAPQAHPFQWDKLWDKLGIYQQQQQQNARRQLEANNEFSGVDLAADDAGVSFGANGDVSIVRSGVGELTVNGTISVVDSSGEVRKYVHKSALEELVQSALKTSAEAKIEDALANYKCADGLTGTYCNETCTDILYYAAAGCLFHDEASADLQTQEAAAFIGYYDPAMSAATVQCCDDDACYRKDSADECWMGTRSDTSPFDIFTDYQSAKDMCEDAGLRLCTLEEMHDLGHDCCGAGCSYDFTVAWTSTWKYNC